MRKKNARTRITIQAMSAVGAKLADAKAEMGHTEVTMANGVTNVMARAAMAAASRYRRAHGVDAVAILSEEGVRVTPVMEAMSALAKPNMSEDERGVWNAKAGELRARVLETPSMVWFIVEGGGGSWNVFQKPLDYCDAVARSDFDAAGE